MLSWRFGFNALIAGFFLAVMTIITPGAGLACTSFCLDRGNGPVVGANFDWQTSDGLIVINKKGVKKRAMTDPEKKLNPVSWESSYGSVTFNMFGIEWPWAGMNEAGLVITSMALEETQYPEPDGRPSLHRGQWVQYQLDNFSRVDEVIANGNAIRIRPRASGHGTHYLVCDQAGKRAVVEFIGGRPLIYTEDTMPVAVLANDPYARSLKNLGNFNGFGGHRPIPDGNASYCRFARTADMLNRSGGGDASATIQYAFEMLDRAGFKNHPRAETQWSLVFDLRARSVLLKTSLNPTIRKIDLMALDYACPSMPETLDIHTPFSKVGNDDFWQYSYEMNRRRFLGVFAKISMKSKTYQKRLERISRYPETFGCVNSEK